MHLRMPSIDQGVQAFVWALVFFLMLWTGGDVVGFQVWTSVLAAILKE